MLEVPVVSGLVLLPRITLMLPKEASVDPPGGQSRVRPVELVVVQFMPTRAPLLQVPWPGLLGVPVAEHWGHGFVTLPESHTAELRLTVWVATPVPRLSEPPAGDAKVLIVHVGLEAGTGSGVPKLQPVLVQSGSLVLSPGAVDVGEMVQLLPEQLSAYRLTPPSGVGLGATLLLEPPR